MGQGPRMSSRLQREGGCYCPGPTPRYLYPSLPSHTKETRAHLIAQGGQVLKGQSGHPSGQGSLCL